MKPGRPSLSDDEPTVPLNASVPLSVKKAYKDLGKGNASLGVRLLLIEVERLRRENEQLSYALQLARGQASSRAQRMPK